jgi:hypothetical protein
LWGAAGAWVAIYIADIIITWQACLHHEQTGEASSHPGLLILAMVVFFILLATALLAGFLAYRAWRKRAGPGKFFEAEGEDRHEYMAMIGVLMTITMAVGILWMGLPLWIISLCVRTR